MMTIKVCLAIFLMMFSSSVHASQVSQVELSATSAIQNVQMMDQNFDPIYETQPYQGTCYQEVYDHTETSCSTVSDSVCHGGAEVCETTNDQVCNSQGCKQIPRRVCHATPRSCTNVPRRVCSDRVITRTQAFSCTKYHEVQVGQRLVKTFLHNVEVVVDRPELLRAERLVISLLARDDQVTPTLVSSFSLNLLTVEVARVVNSNSSANAMITSKIFVHVEAATASISKILTSSVQELTLTGSGITLKLKGIAELAKDLIIDVKLKQKRFLGHKTLFDDSLQLADLNPAAQGEDLLVTIPLAKMDLSGLKSKKHDLSVAVALKKSSLRVLNTNDVSAILSKKLESSLDDVTP